MTTQLRKMNFFFFGGTGFELRASCLQRMRSTASATPPAHFGLVILEMGSLTNYLPGLALNLNHPDLSFLIT
jgi:hypothetical protein